MDTSFNVKCIQEHSLTEFQHVTNYKDIIVDTDVYML